MVADVVVQDRQKEREMPFWSKVTSPGTSKAILRDCISRLRHIRERAGYKDENGNPSGEGTGDKFRDSIIAFTRQGTSVRELVDERNTHQARGLGTQADIARESHDIRMHLMEMKKELQAIRVEVDKSEKDMRKANKKNKKPEKIAMLEKIHREREVAYQNCVEAYDQLEELSRQRNMSEKELKEMKATGGDKTKHKRATERLQLRETLQQRLKRTQGKKTEEGGDDDNGGEVDNRKLEDDPEAKLQIASINKKEAQMNAGLDRVAKTLGRIEEISLQISAELDEQQRIIAGIDDKTDKATSDLKKINKGLTKLLKEQSPMNIIINVACGILLLAMVGYFLLEFGAY